VLRNCNGGGAGQELRKKAKATASEGGRYKVKCDSPAKTTAGHDASCPYQHEDMNGAQEKRAGLKPGVYKGKDSPLQ